MAAAEWQNYGGGILEIEASEKLYFWQWKYFQCGKIIALKKFTQFTKMCNAVEVQLGNREKLYFWLWKNLLVEQKSDNLQYDMLVGWFAGPNDS